MSAVANPPPDATATNILKVLGAQGQFHPKSPHSNDPKPGTRDTVEAWNSHPITKRRATTVQNTFGQRIVGARITLAWHPSFKMATHKFGEGIVHVVTYDGEAEQRMRLFFRRRTNKTNPAHDTIVRAMHDKNLVDRRLFMTASQPVVEDVIFSCPVLLNLATPERVVTVVKAKNAKGEAVDVRNLGKLSREDRATMHDTMFKMANELHDTHPDVETIRWQWAVREFNKRTKTDAPESVRTAIGLLAGLVATAPPAFELVKTALATPALLGARKITMRPTYAPKPDRAVLFAETICDPTLTGAELPTPAEVIGGLQMIMSGKASKKYTSVLHKLRAALVANGYRAGPLMIA